MHRGPTPSAWVVRWSHLVPHGARVLDVACGHGRHLRWFADRGAHVTGVDRSTEALASSHGLGRTVLADIENGPWPFQGERFDAVVVTNYLWRPLLPTLVNSVGETGLLLYETFAQGQASVGKPSRADFLLKYGELLEATAGLHVLAYEEGFDEGFLDAPPRFVQRICATRKPPEALGIPERFVLAAS